MFQSMNHLLVRATAPLMLVAALTSPAFGQAVGSQDADISAGTSASAVRTESGAKKDGQLIRFQARAIVSPKGEGFASTFLAIPAGKRLVIEHVSAIARSPEGFRMEINFFTHLDGTGTESITFHRIVLTEQGTFLGVATAAANHRMLVFADSGVTLQARLNGTTTEFTQAQVTFSGYLEDLPAVQ